MPTDKVKRTIRECADKVEDKAIILSKNFQRYIKGFVNSILSGIKNKPTLELKFDDNPHGPVAYTTGTKIYVNANNSISNSYTTRLNRFLALFGITAHECAHVLFLDFKAETQISNNLFKNGKLHGSLVVHNEEEQDAADSLQDFLTNSCACRRIIDKIYHELSNIFADVHDEAKICDKFHGIVERGILLSTEALYQKEASFEDRMKEYNEGNISEFSMMFSLLLYYARYGKILIKDENAAKDNNFIKILESLATYVKDGCTTDDLDEKFTAINSCILGMWSLLKDNMETLKNLEDEQEESTDDASSGATNSDGTDDSQENDNSSDGSGDGVDKDKLNDLIDEIIDSLNNNGKSMPSPQIDENGFGDSSDKKSSAESDKDMNTETSESALNNLLKRMAEELGREEAERKLEEEAKQKIEKDLSEVDLDKLHKKRVLKVFRDLSVSEHDKLVYTNIINQYSSVLRSLKRRMMSIFEEMRTGTVKKHQVFGSKLNVTDSYRADNKCFSTKKKPQNVPNMAIMILNDMSGSMGFLCNGKSRAEYVREASVVLYDFAHDLGIPVMVCGHCANPNWMNYVRLDIFTDFDDYSGKDKYRIASLKDYNACNRDGMAIDLCANLLSQRPEEVKLMIILSDGKPYDGTYNGKVAKNDIQNILKKYSHKGVDFIAAAIGDDKPAIKEIYGDRFMDISDLSLLPKTLVKVVRKRLLS